MAATRAEMLPLWIFLKLKRLAPHILAFAWQRPSRDNFILVEAHWCYIHTYIHTYMHTYIHTHTPPWDIVHSYLQLEYSHCRWSTHKLFCSHHHHTHCYHSPRNSPQETAHWGWQVDLSGCVEGKEGEERKREGRQEWEERGGQKGKGGMAHIK